jgi:site-specific recombinase XerD
VTCTKHATQTLAGSVGRCTVKRRERYARSSLRDWQIVIKDLTYDGDTVSLQEHLDRWLETSVKGSVKPITYEAYERMCRLHIKPSIGKVKLSKLTPGQVQGFYQDKLNSGLAPSSVRYMHATLHRALKQAHRWRLVRENVAAATDPPIPQPEEIRPLTAEQVKLLCCQRHMARDSRLCSQLR